MKLYVRLLSVVILLALLSGLAACSTETGVAQTSSDAAATAAAQTASEDTETASDELVISKDAGYTFAVVRPADCDSTVTDAAIKLRNAINGLGCQAPIKDDWINRGEAEDTEAYEILVGNTNRTATAETEIPEKSYVIRCDGNKIVICGSTNAQTVAAVDWFIENYVDTAHDGAIHILKDTSFVMTDTAAHFYDIINAENSYSFSVKNKATVQIPTGYNYVQGGCTDGTYYYVSVIYMDSDNQNNNRSIIYKYDMSTWKVVAQNGDLALCHCNDICYNPDTKLLYVANNNPQAKKITILNPETLAVQKSFYIQDNIYSIAYDSVNKRYIVGLSGCENFAVYDSNFKRIDAFDGVVTGYTKQGIECDERYIYLLYYMENCIMVYDWDGKHISRIDLPRKVQGEPEHLCIVDDYLIIGTNGARFVYQVKITKE